MPTLQDDIAAWLLATRAPQPDFSVTTTLADGLVDMAKPSQPKVDWTALAIEGIRNLQFQTPQPQVAASGSVNVGQAPTPWVNTGIRMAGGIAGGLIGSLGGPVGTAAGAAIGGALASNEIAQPREVAQGTRTGVNPLAGFAEGAANMLPVASIGAGPLMRQLPKVMGSAAAGSAAGSMGVQLAEAGRIDPMQTLQETALGTLMGTGVAGGIAGATRVASSPRVRAAATKLATDETGSVGPREPYNPERPLDPTNLPDIIEPRRSLQPAQIDEDIERTFRRNTEFLGMDETTARTLAERSATPEAQAAKRRIMPVSEMQARANTLEAEIPATGKTINAEQQLALADHVRAMADNVEAINARVGDVNALKAGVLKGDPDATARVAELSQEMGVDGVTGIERAQLEAFDQLAKWQLADEAVGSEWGRSGRARQVLAKSRQLDDVAFLKQAYELGLPKPEAIQALTELRGNPAAMKQYLVDLYKPSGQEYWKAYLAFNMLSGPPTLGVNLGSNLINVVRLESARYQAAGLDRASTPKGGTRAVVLPPASLIRQSYADGLRHAGKAFLTTMQTGLTPLETTSVYDGGREAFQGSWISRVLGASGVDERIAKAWGRGAVNGVKRALAGTDAAFQMLLIYPEAYRTATTKAWNKGLRGPELVADIEQQLAALDLGSDVAEPIRKYARDGTFAGKSGEFGAMLQGAVNAVDKWTVKAADAAWSARSGKEKGTFKSGAHYGAMQFPIGFAHFPFLRIAGQLAKQTYQMSVADPVVGAFNLGAQRGDRLESLQRVSQASQFYAFAGILGGLYESGAIDFTAQAPENTFEKEQFYGPQGKTPWAIGINGRYIPLQSLGALGMALAPLGVYLNAAKMGSPDAPLKLTEAIAAIGKVQLDASFVRMGVTLYEGLTDARKQGKLLGNYMAQLTPAGAAGRNLRDTLDPVLRDPGDVGAERRFAGTILAPVSNVVEEGEAQLPGLSKNVRPRLNSYGEPIQKQGIGKRLIGSASTGEDYIGAEILALKETLPDLARMNEGVYPSDLKGAVAAFEKTIEGVVNKGVTREADGVKVRFTDEERQQYMRMVGTAVHEALATMIAPDNPEWAGLTPQDKRAMVKELKRIGKEIGEELFLESWLQ